MVVVHPQRGAAKGAVTGVRLLDPPPEFAPAPARPKSATMSASTPTSNTPIPVDRVTSSLSLRSCICASVNP